MAPSTTKALVTRFQGDKAVLKLEEIPLPRPERHQLLVHVAAVAQNPTDVQALDGNAFGDGAVLGCDFVGTVEKIGDDVTRFKIGDRVAGLIWGGEIPGLGGYSEYTVADSKISFKVPESISSADAATVPLAAATAWLALFSEGCLNIDRDTEEKSPILIWGGSSSVGLYAIQLASLFSIPIIAICSTRNFSLCKSLGATHVFDYNDGEVVSKIKFAGPNISHVFDCIGSADSSITASKALGELKGVLCTVRPGKQFTGGLEENGVRVTAVLVWTAFLKEHVYREWKWPASQADHDLSAELFAKIPGWLVGGKLKTNTSKVLKGLGSVEEGLQMHRDAAISGFKIVYEL